MRKIVVFRGIKSILNRRFIVVAVVLFGIFACFMNGRSRMTSAYIKWVDFSVTGAAMNDAMNYDIKTHGSEKHIDWIDILAYLGTKYGGDFGRYKKNDADKFVSRINNGESVEEITKDMKNFDYFKKAYTAVLKNYLGEYAEGGELKYGLKAFSPIARGYGYAHYDDFGNSRSYGYKRRHLGHDLMGSVGTPVIAVESGYIEAIGWNQYGGWRIGIRSADKQRYYYYAHLRKDHPYAAGLAEGDLVNAGDVIGYLGMTGYSRNENVNNIDTPHLHFGVQLIFDESQKDGTNQIWIDLYELTMFLQKNRQSVHSVGGGDFVRDNAVIDPALIHGD